MASGTQALTKARDGSAVVKSKSQGRSTRMELNYWIATIHGGMWEIFEYTPEALEAIRRVNRQHPGEVKLLGIFPTRIEAIEICARHVSPEENTKRNKEFLSLLGQLAELREKREKEEL
jgi:hypothetical protein